jgi:hypothetical protein
MARPERFERPTLRFVGRLVTLILLQKFAPCRAYVASGNGLTFQPDSPESDVHAQILHCRSGLSKKI